MSSRKTCRKTRQASPSSLRLECLESRKLLAGNVNAQLLGSTLLLTGDALGNEIVVASATGGRIAVLGNGTTINGTAAPFVSIKRVTNLVTNLNGGNDFVGISNNATYLGTMLSGSILNESGIGFTLTPAFNADALQAAISTLAPGVTTFSLPGNLTVTTADGDDFVGLVGNVGGSVVADLGSAIPGSRIGNQLEIGQNNTVAVTNFIGGNLSVAGGNQNDFVALLGTAVVGRVAFTLGNGTNGSGVYGNGATIGSFAYTGGIDDDSVGFANIASTLTVQNGVNIFTGSRGKDGVAMFSESASEKIIVLGDTIINTGTAGDGDLETDDFILLNGDFRRSLTVTTGTGCDNLEVSNSKVALGLIINTGADNDRLAVIDTCVDRNAVILAGGGDDYVFVSDSVVRYKLFVYLGANNGALELNTVSASIACLYCGIGFNVLNTNSATQASVRMLRYYRFQVVNIT